MRGSLTSKVKFRGGGFQLQVDIPKAVVRNGSQLMALAGHQLSRRIQSRLRAGLSSSGTQMPRAKDRYAGRGPLQRTGGLINSISYKHSAYRSSRFPFVQHLSVTVLPTGRSRSGSQRARVRRLQSLAVVSTFQSFAAKTARSRAAASRRVDKLRVRISRAEAIGNQGERHAAIAAILSLPPHDAKSKKGGRGIYRSIEMTQAEDAWIRAFIAQNADIVLEGPNG